MLEAVGAFPYIRTVTILLVDQVARVNEAVLAIAASMDEAILAERVHDLDQWLLHKGVLHSNYSRSLSIALFIN